MPRILKLLLTLIIVAGAYVNYQLWWRLVVEGNLDENSGASGIFPAVIWPVGVGCIIFYLLYLIWREL